jgi:pimeloyl-ACP methyl ester carboxylesterase
LSRPDPEPIVCGMKRLAQWIDTLPAQWRLRRTVGGPAARTRADIRFLDLGDCVIRYRQRGDGPSLVFATDPPVPIELYDELVAALAHRYRVTVFELPGFGCSLPRWRFRFSMGHASDAVIRLLEALGGRHTLWMPCVTGYLGLIAARLRPQMIERLVLSQTPSWADAQRWLQGRDPQRRLRTPVIGQLALAALRRKRIAAWYRSALADETQVERFRSATLSNFDHGGAFALASAFQDFLADHGGLLQPVAVATLHIAGLADRSHRGTRFEDIQSLAPNAHRITLPDVGHFPELEDSSSVLSVFAEFEQSEPL